MATDSVMTMTWAAAVTEFSGVPYQPVRPRAVVTDITITSTVTPVPMTDRSESPTIRIITATTAGISGSGQLVVDPVPVARLEMPESVGVGDQVSVDVRLLSTGYGSVTGAFAFTLNLDPSVLQYSTGSTDYYVALVVDNTGSTMTMVTSVPTGLPDNTVVVTLVFDVVAGAGGPTDLVVSIDRLIEALTFNDLTGDGVGETRSLLIQ